MSTLPTPPPVVRRAWPWLRLVGAGVVLAFLLWHFGTGPFAQAWRLTTWQAVLAALVLTSLTTLTSAWRWRVVSRAFGVPLSVRASVTGYYRSQFLNATLPGGVLGDAHRAVHHGRDVGDVRAGLRATVWERGTGQLVQVGLLLLALVLVPSPLQGLAPLATGALLVVVLVGRHVSGRRHRPAGSRVADDLHALLAVGTAARIAVASVGTCAGHLAVLLVAARVVGVHSSWSVLLVTALAVQVLSAVPLSIAGWGPREGVAAWAFALIGAGSAAGITVAVVYGVVSAVATLPGAAVLVADAVARRTPVSEDGTEAAEAEELEEARVG